MNAADTVAAEILAANGFGEIAHTRAYDVISVHGGPRLDMAAYTANGVAAWVEVSGTTRDADGNEVGYTVRAYNGHNRAAILPRS